tara:strand:+ start:100 stop:2577 length:2478 start_codon:yes stop_codon:yes gene_type:complete
MSKAGVYFPIRPSGYKPSPAPYWNELNNAQALVGTGALATAGLLSQTPNVIDNSKSILNSAQDVIDSHLNRDYKTYEGGYVYPTIIHTPEGVIYAPDPPEEKDWRDGILADPVQTPDPDSYTTGGEVPIIEDMNTTGGEIPMIDSPTHTGDTTYKPPKTLDDYVLYNKGLLDDEVIDDGLLSKITPQSDFGLLNIDISKYPAISGLIESEEKINKKPSDLITGFEQDKKTIEEKYSIEDGWNEVKKIGVLPDGNPKYQKISYGFIKPPENFIGTQEDYENTVINQLIDEYKDLKIRSESGDKNAKSILNHMGWYSDMTTRLRNDYGGLGNIMSELIGATSPNTTVRQNWNYASQILKNYSTGQYDEILSKYNSIIEEERITPNQYAMKHYQIAKEKGVNTAQQQYPLIRSDNNKLFGMNSPKAQAVLLDSFYSYKSGDKPKTIDFSKNLIGGQKPIIDLWSARVVRRLSGRDRIPPIAENAVSGVRSKKDPNIITGEYGFATKMFDLASERIGIQPDQLQALMWIKEKELWTQNGWTSSEGAGGSLELESILQGVPIDQQEKTNELISTITSTNTPTNEKENALLELDYIASQGGIERFRMGLSGERPNDPQTIEKILNTRKILIDTFSNDPNLLAIKPVDTKGRYFGENEDSIDFELIVRKGFDENKLMDVVSSIGQKYDQDSVFVSKSISASEVETNMNARAGLDIYFDAKQDQETINKIVDELNEQGISGFTFIKDMRTLDIPNNVTGQVSRKEYIGLHTQYIPEFEIGNEKWDNISDLDKLKLNEKNIKLFNKLVTNIAEKYDIINFFKINMYDTKVKKLK